ncbi:hypothetical protein Tco_0389665 [Tanacetum coccineum]
MRTRSSLEYTISRRRNRRRSRQQQEAIPIVDTEPEFPMADDRPMAEQLQAPTGGFERGNEEEPHAHIRHFESITNNQRIDNQRQREQKRAKTDKKRKSQDKE